MIRITTTLHEDLCTFMIRSSWILLRMRNISDKVSDKITTHILCSITFPGYRVFCEMMWGKEMNPDKLPMTI